MWFWIICDIQPNISLFTRTANKEGFGGVFSPQTSPFQGIKSFRHWYTYQLPWDMLVIILKHN